MKVLLAAINAKYIHSNLAVYSLKSFASVYADDISIAEYTINQSVDDILSDIYKQNPVILCFSCYLWNILFVKQLIVEVKKVLPDVQIWLGGPEVSYNPVDMLESFEQIMGVMCGEGEETFLELMHFYHGAAGSLDDIKGIVFRRTDDRGRMENIVKTWDRPVMDINKVPFVYKNLDSFHNKIIYYESSRGCPFSCSYCLSSVDKCLRFRDLNLVKRELQLLIEAEIPQVKFIDRTFNCSHTHALAVWSYIAGHDRGITNFHFEVAADLLNQEELCLLQTLRPGLIQLEIGIQSTNPDTIREIRRVMELQRVKRAVKHIKAGKNIHQHLDLIAGLPLEDYKSFRKSFNDVYALCPDQLQLGFLKVLKGSAMHEKAKEYGLKYQDSPPFEVLSTKWLSYGEIIRLKGIEEMVEVYYNSGQYKETLPVLAAAFPDAFAMFEELSLYYEKHRLHILNHTRITRYKILCDFATDFDEKNKDKYKELLTIDLYLRENVKSRPTFAGEPTVSKEEAAAFYDKEAREHQYLKGYEQYDKRQMRKMTHLEKKDGKILLFDYMNREILTNQARLYYI